MTSGDAFDSMPERALAALGVHDAGPERTGRIRARCLSALARRGPRAEAPPAGTALWRDRLELALAAGLSAAHLAGAVERALEILR